MTEKKSRYSFKNPNRGGKRENAGRPKGTTNKISPTELIEDFKKQSGMDFHTFINQQILKAYNENNSELVSRYLLGFSKYLIHDIQKIDMTSNGESIQTQIVINSKELSDWTK